MINYSENGNEPQWSKFASRIRQTGMKLIVGRKYWWSSTGLAILEPEENSSEVGTTQ